VAQLVWVTHHLVKFACFLPSSQFPIAVPGALVEIIEPHFQNTLGNGNAGGFLHGLCIVLEEDQASKNVVLEAMNRQVNALSKWRTLDFLGLGMGAVILHLFVKLLQHASGFFG